MALAIVPSIGLPVFAGLFTEDKLAQAKAAGRIGHAMTLGVEMHDVQKAIAAESAAAAMKVLSARYGMTTMQLTELIGADLVVPIPVARALTDKAFAVLVPDEASRRSIDDLRSRLEEVRAGADTDFVEAGTEAASGWELYQSYADLVHLASDIQLDTIQRVVTGHYGVGSPALLVAIAQLERVTTAADIGNEQGFLLNGVFSATSPEDRAAVVTDLRSTTNNWEHETVELPSHVSAPLQRTWAALINNEDIVRLNHYVTDELQLEQGDLAAESEAALRSGRTLLILSTGLRDLVHQAGTAGIDVAQVDEVEADQRARTALGVTIALLLVTGGLLIGIGGTLRRRLGDLAVAAERFSAGQLVGMPVHGPREIAVASDALNDAVASFSRVAVQAERLSAGDLDAPELLQAAPGALGQAVHASVNRIVEAVREHEKLREALAHQAAHDDLTLLPNRAETERLLDKALARAQRSDSRVAVLFIDLDHFKACNDSLGHAAGDHVLRTAAARMTSVVRPGDTVCRLGGDEFVVVVEPVGNDRSVVEIAERVVAALAESMTFGDDVITVGGTVGVAISDDESDADSLLREADSAMYQAKATARGSIGIYNEALRVELHREAEFRVAMANALVNGELELYYQPVIDIPNGRVAGFEALARWQRPGHGMIPPDQFIPMAEQSGLIIDIGQWALNTATSQLVAWSADPAYADMHVAVNLSGRHLAHPGVVDDVRDALVSSGLEPHRLMVEITESIAIDTPTSVDHLAQVAALGVLVALDDFGTGYTSIGQLLYLPVHVLKIDRSLVSGSNEDGTAVLERSTKIIELIVEVAHSLDLTVIAEGVEEPSQLAKLAETSCDSAQGYLFSRPLPIDQVASWLASHTKTRHHAMGTNRS
jgi:diguanylate cyclase (GGDEF)-like protein